MYTKCLLLFIQDLNEREDEILAAQQLIELMHLLIKSTETVL